MTTHQPGEAWETEYHTLALGELAPHTHTATFTSSGGGGTAGGTVEIPVTGAVKIGASSSASKTNQLTKKGVLVRPNAPSTAICGPAGTSADVQFGPDNAVTGTAKDGISLPVSGGGGSGGTMTANPTGGGQRFPISQPSIAMRYCMVLSGLFPSRND